MGGTVVNRTKTNYLQPLAISGIRKDGMSCDVDLWNHHNFRACSTPRHIGKTSTVVQGGSNGFDPGKLMQTILQIFYF